MFPDLPLQVYRSAFMHLLSEANVTLTKAQKRDLAQFYGGLERQEAEERQAGQRPSHGGMESFTFKHYRWTNAHFISIGDEFSWLYSSMMWNTLCRSNNVKDINLEHFSSFEDCIGIVVPKTKADPGLRSSFCSFHSIHHLSLGGKRNQEPSHIYGNPLDYRINVLLALGVWFLIHQPTDAATLFPGGPIPLIPSILSSPYRQPGQPVLEGSQARLLDPRG